MESYLISRKRQTVNVAGQAFELEAWEAIHTEVSCKYSDSEISALLAEAGLSCVRRFSDRDDMFADVACTPIVRGDVG
jgi:uncharacterized SAM-dependent methyltransferase